MILEWLIQFVAQLDSIYGLLGAGLALVSGLGSRLFFRLARGRAQEVGTTPTVDDQIGGLRSNLEASRALIKQINAEFELQVPAAEKIKAEAEQNRRLAALSAEQAQAAKNLVESVQGNASKIGGRQQWQFFPAGLLAAVPLGVVGNFAFEAVKAWLVSSRRPWANLPFASL